MVYIAKSFPLKQGLWHKYPCVDADASSIAKSFPLKQGLWLTLISSNSSSSKIAKSFPLKQGLWHLPLRFKTRQVLLLQRVFH